MDSETKPQEVSEAKEEQIEQPKPPMVVHEKVAILIARASKVPQRSKEWFRRRRTMITCSDAAAVLGVNPHQTRTDVFKRKIGEKRPFAGSAATRHGQTYEPIALKKYEEETENPLIHEDFGLLSHPKYPKIGGSPDGITANGILIEVKCPYTRRIIPGTIPALYVPQVQLLLEICDLEIGHFVQYRQGDWLQGEQLEIVEVKRDREWFKWALPLLLSFVDELEEYWRAHNVAIGTPMVDWDEIDRKEYEAQQARRKRECAIIEDDAFTGQLTIDTIFKPAKRLRSRITLEDQTEIKQDYEIDSNNGVRVDCFDLTGIVIPPPKPPSPVRSEMIEFDAQATSSPPRPPRPPAAPTWIGVDDD